MFKPTAKFGVLCDTGFLIRLNSPNDELHENARDYLRLLLEKGHHLYVSTIALAEYAVRDKIENLPLRYFRVLPFNIDHAQKAGEFAGIVYSKRDQIPLAKTQRIIIPNDTKMFAQADVTSQITHYLTADLKCEAVCKLLQASTTTRFHFMSLHVPCRQWFGLLNL